MSLNTNEEKWSSLACTEVTVKGGMMMVKG